MNRKREIMFTALRTLLAVGIALLIAFIIIICVSDQPSEALKAFITGPFSTTRRMGNVIEAMIPLIFTGLAACVMFQAKQFSLIGDGSFFTGALVTAVFTLKVALPAGLHPLVAILLGGMIGAVCGIIPGYLKAKWNTNEFVVSMMFNSILVYLGVFVLLNIIRDPNSGFLASYSIPETAKLGVLIHKTNVHFGLIIAFIMVILVYLFLYKTKWGFSIRMVGSNSKFSKYSGINTFMVVMLCQVIGGFIAGIGGSVELLGMYDRFQWQDTPGFGFDGMTVAILASNNPALVPIGALFLAYVRVGTDVMARTSNVPNEAVNIIQGIVMILITASAFLSNWRHKMVVSGAKKTEEEKKLYESII